MGVRQPTPAASGDQCHDVLTALDAFNECSAQVETEPLKGAMGKATASLLHLVERHARDLVQFLLGGLATGDSDLACYDKLWTLRSMAKKSELTRRWIVEAGGLAAIARALGAHPKTGTVQKEGVWLVFVLRDKEGIAQLLQQCRGCAGVQIAASWAIYDLAFKQRSRGFVGVEWPEANTLMMLLLDALQTPGASIELLWATTSAIWAIIDAHPCRGTAFIEKGGAEATLAALKVGEAAGTEGESLLVSGMQLIAALVDGNASAAEALRSKSALQIMVSCGLRVPGKVSDEMMWALGQVGGVLPVLQVLDRADSPAAVKSGLSALAKLTWRPLEEGLQQQLPMVVEPLSMLVRRVVATKGPTVDLVFALQALGGALHVLAPHVEPGSWPAMDDAVNVLTEALHMGNDDLVAQAAVASLGHIATKSPAWRRPLQRCLCDLERRMRSPGEKDESIKHQKCLFWVSAVIAGLPVLIAEMRAQPNSPTVQDAAICAVIDILDDHVDGTTSLGEGTVDTEHVPEVITVVAGAMRLHRTSLPVQRNGCRALGLLHSLLPADKEVPIEVFNSVLAALRWHTNDYKVTLSVLGALRLLLEPRGGRASSVGLVLQSTVAVLRSRGVAGSVEHLLGEFGRATDMVLLEDAFYALGLVGDIPACLRVLAKSEGSQVHLRAGGLKALFELGRSFPDLLAPPRSAEIHGLTAAIASEAQAAVAVAEGEACIADGFAAERAELVRRAELLCGALHVARS